LIRGWSVTIVAALFALAAKDADRRFVIVAYFPAAMFWALDAYYLHQERLFRSLYDGVRAEPCKLEPFCMDTSATARKRDTWKSALVSKTMLIFHGTIIVVIALVMFALTH